MRKKELFEEIKRIREAINKGEVEGAYEKTKILLKENSSDFFVKSNSPGIFIDLGNSLGKLDYVEDGISLLEETLKDHEDLDFSTYSILTYNLSNGYYSKYLIFHKRHKYIEAIEANNKAKALLQNLLLHKSKIEMALLQQIMANYANCLDHVGRAIEAIDQYNDCLRLFPNQGLAMANCGNSIRYIIGVSGVHRPKNYFEAWKLLKTACTNEENILAYASKSSLNKFKNDLENLENIINQTFEEGLEQLIEYDKHRKEVHGFPKVDPWVEKIKDDRLLLTLNQNPLNSVEECVDDVLFQGLITEPGESGTLRFTKLANIVNNIKEDFATARYLFYKSDEREELPKIGRITQYVNTLDYAQFGLSSGLLKGSFRLAADCLDKIATLLSEYFELGNEDKNRSFNNFWFVDCVYKKGIITDLEKRIKENRYLGALKNLQADWFLQEFPGPLKDIRDDATHKRLTLYWLNPSIKEHESIQSYSYDEFREITFFLLRMVKAAIIYSLISITIEEEKKPKSDFILPMPIDYGPGITEQDYDFGDSTAG